VSVLCVQVAIIYKYHKSKEINRRVLREDIIDITVESV